MATPEQINAANAAARNAETLQRVMIHDTSALEIERLRAVIRRAVLGALPMQAGYVIRDEDFAALREEIEHV